MLANFSTWLDNKRLDTDEVDWSTVERYLRFRRKAGKLRNEDASALRRVLRMLRAGQVEAPSSPPTARQIVLEQFQHYLRQERGLADGTIKKYTPIVRAFLADKFPAGPQTSIKSRPPTSLNSYGARPSVLPLRTRQPW